MIKLSAVVSTHGAHTTKVSLPPPSLSVSHQAEPSQLHHTGLWFREEDAALIAYNRGDSDTAGREVG